jgi:hypothetical protein
LGRIEQKRRKSIGEERRKEEIEDWKGREGREERKSIV